MPDCKALFGLMLCAGVPVSEDVLLIYVGTLLGSSDLTVCHKVASVAWCYVGVVLSDCVSVFRGTERVKRFNYHRQPYNQTFVIDKNLKCLASFPPNIGATRMNHKTYLFTCIQRKIG